MFYWIGATATSIPEIVEGKLSVWSVLPENIWLLLAMVAPIFVYISLQIVNLSKTLARLQAEEAAKDGGEKAPEVVKKKGSLLKYVGLAVALGVTVYFVGFQEEYSIKSTMNAAVDWIRDQGGCWDFAQ